MSDQGMASDDEPVFTGQAWHSFKKVKSVVLYFMIIGNRLKQYRFLYFNLF
jgi:hypothetical protein